jgi:hypothetical protein
MWYEGVMETKKLGFLIIGISIVLGFIMFNFMNRLNVQEEQLHCNPTQECQEVRSVLGMSHIAVGFLAFIFALGFYLLFFNKSEKEVMDRYIDDKISNNNLINNKNILKESDENLDRFSFLLRPLDENERKVLVAIKDQQGITQSTLRFRTDLSKAKISQVLNDFEKKNLITRKEKGKTYSVFLTDSF